MNELEKKIYGKLSEDATNRELYSLQDSEDTVIEEAYENKNFVFPDYEDVIAKRVFNSIIGALNKKSDIIVEHKFGKLKNNIRYAVLTFCDNKYAIGFLEHEKGKEKLFPNIELKHLEENKLIALYRIAK